MSLTADGRVDSAIKSVQRALDLLEALTTADELSVTELSRETGLDKSTVSRQLASLEARRFVTRSPRSQKFSLGFRLLELGNRVAARYELLGLAEPGMRHLRDVVDETIGFHIRVGRDERVCLGQVESRAEVRRSLRVGEVVSLLPGAPGKCFLAFLPPEERAPVLAEALAAVRKRGLIVDEEGLGRELDAGRVQSYVHTRNERVVGGAGVAFPVYGAEGKLIAVLSISGPASRMVGEHLDHCVRAGLRQADGLGGMLGQAPLGAP